MSTGIEMTENEIKDIDGFFSQYEQINLNLGSDTNIPCYYSSINNLYIILIKDEKTSKNIQNIGQLKNKIEIELESKLKDKYEKKSKIFLIDYTRSLLPEYDVIDINSIRNFDDAVKTFNHQKISIGLDEKDNLKTENKDYKTFDEFKETWLLHTYMVKCKKKKI